MTGPSRPSARRPVLRAALPGDWPAVAGLISWLGTGPPAERWAWRYRDAPRGAVALVLELDGEVVGHMGHVGFDAWVDGELRLLGQGGDTVVARGHQGPFGMKRLVEGFLALDHGYDLRQNFPTERAGILMERFGGGSVIGRLPVLARGDARGAGLSSPALRTAARLGSRLVCGTLAAPPTRLRVDDLGEPGAEVDELALASRAYARCIRVRDARYLRWRWLDPRAGASELRAARDRAGRLRGWAVLGADRSVPGHGIVADVLAADAAALRALLVDGYRRLSRQGLANVFLPLHDPRPWARRAAVAAGFLPTKPGQRVTCRSLSATVGDAPESIASWYLTAGDAD